VLVVGGGTGGCSVAAKLSYRFGAGNVVVLDAAEVRKIKVYLCFFESVNCVKF
jgi:choline dehydrogenase-like flavoprotein